MIVEILNITKEVEKVINKVREIKKLIFNFLKIKYKKKIENDEIVKLANLP